MKTNVILCVLNRMFPRIDSATGENKLPGEETYYSADLSRSFSGVQANEAPVKLLISEAYASGNPIDEIIYLCSNKCADRSLEVSQLDEIKGFPADSYPDGFSAEEFFFERIGNYCRQNGFPAPTFNPLPYNPSRPADSLPTLNQFLDGTYEVSIDITGGRRDAVILQTLAIQLLKMQSDQNSIGSIVYSNYEDKTIVKQNTTFNLIELINSLDAFVKYGRADQLVAFFKDRPYASNETLSLCESMAAFSDALALCQVADIDEKAKAVQRGIAETEAALTRKLNDFALITNALEALNDPDGWICEFSLDEALEEIKKANLPIDVSSNDESALRKSLENARWGCTIIRGELLFHSLLPAMKKKFIPETSDNNRLIMNTIIWCANHQMIQQAMCIFRERISECLVSFGFFIPTSHFNNSNKFTQAEIVGDLCGKCQVGEARYNQRELFFLEGDKFKYDYNDYFTFNEEKFSSLLMIMAWYKYLHGLRNMIMHVDSRQETLGYTFSCVLLGKDPDEMPSVSVLKSYIMQALKCIKEPKPIDSTTWNNAFSKAKQVRNDRYGKNSSGVTYSSGDRSEQSYVTSVMELQLLLMSYDRKSKEVDIKDFGEWCLKEKGKQLNKKSLGLDPDIAFYKGLCQKYPEKFKYRIDGDKVFLICK